MNNFKKIGIVFILLMLPGCGSLTGLPGHGGGKRFAVEQELMAAAIRATIKKIDLTVIKGKKVNLFVNPIGDAGAGNLIGGRLSLVSQLRGDYIQSPPVEESYVYPRYSSTTSATSVTDALTKDSTETIQDLTITSSGDSSTSTNNSSSSTTSTLLPAPIYKETINKGAGGQIQVGVEYNGLGSYRNSEEIESDDLQYLSGLLQTYLFLQGVYVVPPSEAEIDVYVTIDVFGTIRTRVDWFLANNEILKAKTSVEVIAVDHLSGKLIMRPQAAGTEAEYNEQYVFWAGPVIIKKTLKDSGPLMCDFTDLSGSDTKEQDAPIPYPFQHQISNWMEDNDE